MSNHRFHGRIYRNISFALMGILIIVLFYRRFTKFIGFTAKTSLGVVHMHYFMLGMVFFILMFLLEKSFSFTGARIKGMLVIYHIGLNLTAVMLVVRGVTQVMEKDLSVNLLK